MVLEIMPRHPCESKGFHDLHWIEDVDEDDGPIVVAAASHCCGSEHTLHNFHQVCKDCPLTVIHMEKEYCKEKDEWMTNHSCQNPDTFHLDFDYLDNRISFR